MKYLVLSLVHSKKRADELSAEIKAGKLNAIGVIGASGQNELKSTKNTTVVFENKRLWLLDAEQANETIQTITKAEETKKPKPKSTKK